MKSIKKSLLFFALMSLNTISFSEPIYTSLAEQACKTTSVEVEVAASTQLCPGVDGYKLKLTDSDNRQNLVVIDPKGNEHPLDIYQKVAKDFSTFEPQVEWVKKNNKPSALITSMVFADDKRKSGKRHSVVVAKISPKATCIVGFVETTSLQDKRVRKLANLASSKKCL